MRSNRLAAVALFFLAPVCAEYVVGYDSSAGRPFELLAGLLILGPLYGAAALIIREVGRRLQLSWVGIVLLAAAFGIVEAGLVDQSMFNPSYRDIDYWQDLFDPTFIPMLGLSAHAALSFVVGHVVYSICVPIVLIESLQRTRRGTPWLGPLGLAVTVMLYVSASALILWEHLDTEEFSASQAQLSAAGVAVFLLTLAGVTLGRRTLARRPTRAVGPWVLGTGAFVAAAVFHLLPATWLGFAICAAVLAAVVLLVWWLSRDPGWAQIHRVALAGGALLPWALLGFLIDPIGDVSTVAKLLHNTVMTLGVAGLVFFAARRANAADRDLLTSPT